MGVTVAELRAIAEERLASVPEGEPLDVLSRALIDLGVKSSTAALSREPIEAAITTAYDAGATPEQLAEVLTFISALGTHSLMAGMSSVATEATKRGLPLPAADEALWREKIGDDPYWDTFERNVPRFLRAIHMLAPRTFRAFFEYCALPFTQAKVRARVKELIAVAADASSVHRFAPGFRQHLENAIKLGAGRRAVLEAMDLGAACPPHDGYA